MLFIVWHHRRVYLCWDPGGWNLASLVRFRIIWRITFLKTVWLLQLRKIRETAAVVVSPLLYGMAYGAFFYRDFFTPLWFTRSRRECLGYFVSNEGDFRSGILEASQRLGLGRGWGWVCRLEQYSIDRLHLQLWIGSFSLRRSVIFLTFACFGLSKLEKLLSFSLLADV